MAEEKTIGGFKYRMEQLGGRSGRKVMLRLARPFAALLGSVASKGVTKAGLLEIGMQGLAPALESLSEEDFEFCCELFAEKTIVFLPDGPKTRDWPLKDVFDSHFAGRYSEMLQWLYWAIETNRFFGDALERFTALRAAAPSTSPTESTGGNGVSSSATA